MGQSKKKGCNPLVAVLIVGCLFLIGLVLVIFGGKMALEKWVQGDGFKDWLQKKAATELKAEVNIDDITWEGLKANVGTFNAHGYQDAAFSRISANAIKAELEKIAGKTVQVSDIHVTRAYMEFSDDKLPNPNPVSANAATPAASASTGSSMPGWLKRFVPEKVELGDVLIGSTTLSVKGEGEEVLFGINETKAQISPELSTGNAAIRLKDGEMLITKAPEMTIREAKLRWQDSSLFVNSASIGIYGDGHVASEGEIEFADQTLFNLNLTASEIDIKKVVPEDWKKRISGTVRGPVKVVGPIDSLTQKGTVHLDGGVLQGVDILDKIAKFTKSERFSRIVLNQAQSDFEMKGDVLSLRNIQLQSDGLMRIEGTVNKQGENLNGVLQVGVDPESVKIISGTIEKVFTESRDGLLWTQVTLGGTTDDIEEDLTSRMIGAAASGLVDRLPEGLRDLLGGGDENVDTPAGNGGIRDRLIDKVGDVIDDKAKEGGTIDKAKKIFDALGPLFGN